MSSWPVKIGDEINLGLNNQLGNVSHKYSTMTATVRVQNGFFLPWVRDGVLQIASALIVRSRLVRKTHDIRMSLHEECVWFRFRDTLLKTFFNLTSDYYSKPPFVVQRDAKEVINCRWETIETTGCNLSSYCTSLIYSVKGECIVSLQSISLHLRDLLVIQTAVL